MNFGFNLDVSRMTVASEAGFQIFDLPPSTVYRRVRNESSLGGVSIVATLEKTPLVAVVGSGRGSSAAQTSNRFLQLFDMGRNEVLTEMHFDTPILNVRLNLKRLVVILEKNIHLFDLNTMAPLPQVRTTHPVNRLGLGALSSLTQSGSCFLAFPQSAEKDESRGDLFVMDAMGLQQISVIPAHRNGIVAVEFCSNASRVATCSAKGTVIRVFSNPNPQLLFTFRRGRQDAVIYSLAFSPSGDLLASTSDSGTLHIFKCEQEKASIVAEAEGTRSFAKISIKDSKTKTICGIGQSAEMGTVISIILCPRPGEQGTLTQHKLDKDKPKLIGEYPF